MNKESISYIIKASIILAVLSVFFIQHSQSGGYIEPEYIQHTLTEDVAFFCPGETILKKGETVSILAKVADDDYLWVETASGMRGSMRGYKNYPRPKYEFNWSNGAYIMPMDLFYEEVINKSFDELDSKHRKFPYIHERPAKGNTVNLELQYLLYDPETWNTYHPRITFIDGIALDVDYIKEKNRNKWLLRFSPFAYKLSCNSFINKLTSKSQLTELPKFYDNKFMNILSGILKFLHTLLYMAFIGWIPSIFMTILLRWPAPLKFVPNSVMYVIMPLIGIISSYLGFVICLLEGYPWWFMAIVLALSCLWTSFLGVEYITMRCPKCKTIGSLNRINRIFNQSHRNISRGWEKTYLGTATDNINGIIKTTEYRPYDGKVFSERSREGVVGQVKTSIYKHELVEKEFKTKVYTDTFLCKSCGYKYDKKDSETDLISKEVLDSKVTHNSTTEYFYDMENK